MKRLVDAYLQPLPHQTIIDLGCGTGDLVRFLDPTCSYIGVDHNPAYLSPGSLDSVLTEGRHIFVNADLGQLDQLDLPAADAAFALGVLHHLPDQLVVKMLRTALEILKPGGRLVTVDPVFVPDQASSARVMMALDRGRFVRHVEHYQDLFARACPGAEMHLRNDINPFPYNHIIFVASAPSPES
jgi:SAM-dependent methyltransferase